MMSLPQIRLLLKDQLAIDLGTSRTRVAAWGRGMVVNQPTLLAYNRSEERVDAVGLEAFELEGRTAPEIRIINPLHDGSVADSALAGELLKKYLDLARERRFPYFSPRVLIAVPAESTDVEHSAIRHAAIEAGIIDLHFVNKGYVMLLGAGITEASQPARLMVDIGAGTMTVAAIARNYLIFSRTWRVGGNDMDGMLIEMIKQNHSLLIGPRTAERVKIELGCAMPLEFESTTQVKGQKTNGGSPWMEVVNGIEVQEAIEPVVQRIIKCLQEALEALPPEAAADIYDQGIVLAGGTALLTGLDERITRETRLPVRIIETPQRAVIHGLSLLFESPKALRRALLEVNA